MSRAIAATVVSSRMRRLVFARAAEMLFAYVLAIWVVYVHLLHRSFASTLLPLAAAFVIVQSVAIGLLIAAIVGRALVAEFVERRARRLRPPIVDAPMAWSDRREALTMEYRRRHSDANANDLDIFLMDLNGRVLGKSDRGLNGQAELTSVPALPAGTYVVEIRSFYIKAETGNFVFNSGDYRLSVAVQ